MSSLEAEHQRSPDGSFVSARAPSPVKAKRTARRLAIRRAVGSVLVEKVVVDVELDPDVLLEATF
jgi:hypothetical protein